MNKNSSKIFNLEFIIRKPIDHLASDYFIFIPIILAVIWFILAICDVYFFNIDSLLLSSFGYSALATYILWNIVNYFVSRKLCIGTVKLTMQSIILKIYNNKIEFDLNRIESLEIIFRVQYGNLTFFSTYIETSCNNIISFDYENKRYNFYFISESSDDLIKLEKLLFHWKKIGIQYTYIAPDMSKRFTLPPRWIRNIRDRNKF